MEACPITSLYWKLTSYSCSIFSIEICYIFNNSWKIWKKTKKLVDIYCFIFFSFGFCEWTQAVKYKSYRQKCIEESRQKYKCFSLVDRNMSLIFFLIFLSTKNINDFCKRAIIRFKMKGYPFKFSEKKFFFLVDSLPAMVSIFNYLQHG